MRQPGMWKRERLVWLAGAAVLGLLVLGRQLVMKAAAQLVSGALVALAAMPLQRFLEKKFKPSLAAALSLAVLGVGAAAAVGLLLPALAAQARQLLALLPQAAQKVSGFLSEGEAWLIRNGLPITGQLRQTIADRGREWLGRAAPAVLGWAQQRADGFSRWMLAPVFGYYFLRDRQLLGRWLLLLLPIGLREVTVQFLRETRREVAGYLRGQLMLSLIVGGLTATGLLLCGLPAWLLLGAAMGVLELIPYVGPLAGGALVALFGLQSGTGRVLWALGVVLAVQQLESSWLSPKMMSNATRLHPMAVVLSILLGGSAAGITGVLLAVPLVLCIRAALKVWALRRSEWSRAAAAFVKER